MMTETNKNFNTKTRKFNTVNTATRQLPAGFITGLIVTFIVYILWNIVLSCWIMIDTNRILSKICNNDNKTPQDCDISQSEIAATQTFAIILLILSFAIVFYILVAWIGGPFSALQAIDRITNPLFFIIYIGFSIFMLSGMLSNLHKTTSCLADPGLKTASYCTVIGSVILLGIGTITWWVNRGKIGKVSKQIELTSDIANNLNFVAQAKNNVQTSKEDIKTLTNQVTQLQGTIQTLKNQQTTAQNALNKAKNSGDQEIIQALKNDVQTLKNQQTKLIKQTKNTENEITNKKDTIAIVQASKDMAEKQINRLKIFSGKFSNNKSKKEKYDFESERQKNKAVRKKTIKKKTIKKKTIKKKK